MLTKREFDNLQVGNELKDLTGRKLKIVSKLDNAVLFNKYKSISWSYDQICTWSLLEPQ